MFFYLHTEAFVVDTSHTTDMENLCIIIKLTRTNSGPYHTSGSKAEAVVLVGRGPTPLTTLQAELGAGNRRGQGRSNRELPGEAGRETEFTGPLLQGSVVRVQGSRREAPRLPCRSLCYKPSPTVILPLASHFPRSRPWSRALASLSPVADRRPRSLRRRGLLSPLPQLQASSRGRLSQPRPISKSHSPALVQAATTFPQAQPGEIFLLARAIFSGSATNLDLFRIYVLLWMESQGTQGEVGGPRVMVILVEFRLSLHRNSLHIVPQFRPHLFSKALREQETNCRFFIPIHSCRHFRGWGSWLPDMAILMPQLISRKDHKNKAQTKLSRTKPSPPKRGELRGKKWKLLNWMMPRTILTPSRMVGTGRIIG